MDDQARERIRTRCLESLEQNDTLRNALPNAGPDTRRADFARCAIDLALEHHSAIIGLVLHGHYGSAAALIRPLMEAAIMAGWLMYVASCEKIERLSVAERDGTDSGLPSISEMAKALEKIPVFSGLGGLFETRGAARFLHKYTHGDIQQLSRRGRVDAWHEKEIISHLLLVDSIMVNAASLGTVIHDVPDLAAYVFPRRDALGEEAVNLGLASSIQPQPNCLPPPLQDGCGPVRFS